MPRNQNSPVSQPILAEPQFAETDGILPDPADFDENHKNDNNIYASIKSIQNTDIVPIPPARGNPTDLLPLAQAYGSAGASVVAAITAAKQISFHVAGDSGATTSSGFAQEITVFESMTNDVRSVTPGSSPAFFYHVGDLVYDFGEAGFYFGQFYDALRNYPRPIYAIPGNHDSFIVPNTLPAQYPLTTFQSNFCATGYVVTPQAGSCHRTAQTQPGVYFALDAPFVRIIGLFSNALEGIGVISSQGGTWKLQDIQLDFLRAQLTQIKTENYAGALVLAVHHPLFSYYSGTGGGNALMLKDIDSICDEVGVYPHAFLTGHVHNMQRFTRTVQLNGTAAEVPVVIAGNGGHHVNPIVSSGAKPKFGANLTASNPYTSATFAPQSLVLDEFDDEAFGYLTVTATAQQLTIAYTRVEQSGTVYVNPTSSYQPVTVPLSRSAIYK